MAQITDKVKPGDLITAQLMNRIIDEINALQARVAGLEAAGPVGGKVYITDIKPHDPPPRVNQEMHIVGQNFGFLIGATEVMLNDVRVDSFLPGSNDQNLIFLVPVLEDLPPEGDEVTVKVSNVTQSAQKNVVIMPAELEVEGGVDVLFKTADPLKITPDNPVTFEYNLKSRATLAADYTITTEITGVGDPAPWQSQLELLNSQKAKVQNKQVHLDLGETKTFFIRIPKVPSNTSGVEFGLKVTATSGTVVGADGPTLFTVGESVVPPDPDTNLLFNTGAGLNPVEFLPGTAGSLNANTSPATIVLQKPTAEVSNPLARAKFTAVVRVVGSYEVKALITSGTGWTATVNTSQLKNPFDATEDDFKNSDEVTKPLLIVVKALSSATAQAELEVQLQKVGSTLKQTKRLNLALPTKP